MIHLFITLLLSIVILCFMFVFMKSVYIDIRNRSFKMASIKVILAVGSILGVNIINNYSIANRMPTSVKNNAKQYIVDVNEVKSDSVGTKIILKKAFMDLNNVSFTLGAKGDAKLVAVEIKKKLEDKEPLTAMKGMWIGNKLTYQYTGMSASYKGNEFLEELYIVCYLSNGEEITFKLEDKNNIKDKVEIIQVDKELEYEGKKVKIKTLTRALSYTILNISSDIVGFHPQKLYIIQGGKEFESGAYGATGGNYSFSFEPINKDDISIKLVNKNLNSEAIVKVR